MTRGIMAVLIIRGRYGVATPSNYPPTPYFTDVATDSPVLPVDSEDETTGDHFGLCPEQLLPR